MNPLLNISQKILYAQSFALIGITRTVYNSHRNINRLHIVWAIGKVEQIFL